MEILLDQLPFKISFHSYAHILVIRFYAFDGVLNVRAEAYSSMLFHTQA